MKKDLAKPIFLGAVYACCLTLFILMTATRLGAVKLAELSAGYGMFDAKFFYTPEKFYEVLALLGEAGRMHYLQTHLFDYAFLTLFVVVQFTIVYFIFNKLGSPAKYSFVFLPIIGQFFADIAENITIDVLIRWVYPTESFGWVRFASAMTILKWIFLAMWVISVIVMLVMLMLKKLKKMNDEA